MTRTCRFVFAATLTAWLAGPALANDADRFGPYSSTNIYLFFNDELRAELKITADQQRGLALSEERRNQLWKQHIGETSKIQNSKLPEREQNAKLRPLDLQFTDDMIKIYSETLRPEQIKRMKQIVLQMRGIGVVDFPEIRKALKIGDAEAKELHSAWDKWANEKMQQLRSDVSAKKITNQDAAKIAGDAKYSVPEPVRESLSKEQKRTLEDLLGPKFNYKK
jgi:hypothetical protein